MCVKKLDLEDYTTRERMRDNPRNDSVVDNVCPE